MSWIAVGGAAVSGIVQIASAQKKKKEAALEEQASKAPKYTGSPTLEKYYNQTEQLANVAAQNSALYKQSQQQTQRNMASGLAGSNIAQGGQGLVSKLVQGTNDASMKNLSIAEGQKERRFGQFGQASQMKSADDWKKFQINQQQPWETKYNLLAAKAAKAAEQQQAGFSNITGALTTAGTALAKYGKGGGGGDDDTSTDSSEGVTAAENAKAKGKKYSWQS